MTLPSYAMNQMSFPEMYERWLVEPLFRPWAEVLLQRSNPSPGDRVLDLACGTGIVARLAKEKVGGEGQVVGIDVSAPMLAVARSIAPSIEWREGNAGALPIDDVEKFDVVLCQQGLQFFPDKPAAAREMRRVLAPAGRLAVAVWRSLEENPFLHDLHAVAERHLGPIVDHRHGFGDANALDRLLNDAGFHNVEVESMSRTIRFPDGSVFLRLNAMALVGMSASSKTMSDEERARIVALIVQESGGAVKPYTKGEGLSYEITANVAAARG